MRRNTDARIRELERSIESGGATGSEVGEYARLLIRAGGDRFERWCGCLLYDAFLRSPLESRLRIMPDDRVEEMGETGLLVSAGITASVYVPDWYGRAEGLHLVATITGRLADWDTESIRERIKQRAAGTEFEPSMVIEIRAELSGVGPLHPFFFWYMNPNRWTRWTGGADDYINSLTPLREEHENLLVSRFTRDRFVNCVMNSMSGLRGRTDSASDALRSVTDMTGWPITREAAIKVAESVVNDSYGFSMARLALQAAPGQRIGPDTPPYDGQVQAHNISGGGILNAALRTLASWLISRRRAVVTDIWGADPYDNEGGYFSRGHMSVTNRRARRTSHPLRIEADMDSLNGARESRDWIGNEFPSGGEWRIDITYCPPTVADLHEPIIGWIRAAFPSARIIVATRHESYGHPDYVRV